MDEGYRLEWRFYAVLTLPLPTAHISRSNSVKVSDMAATMDSQISQNDDLTQDLMGLQELDSHLAMFESSGPGRDSSTPGAISNSQFDDSVNTFDRPSHTIIVDSPDDKCSQQIRSELKSRARPTGPNSVYHITKYVTMHNHTLNSK